MNQQCTQNIITCINKTNFKSTNTQIPFFSVNLLVGKITISDQKYKCNK